LNYSYNKPKLVHIGPVKETDWFVLSSEAHKQPVTAPIFWGRDGAFAYFKS